MTGNIISRVTRNTGLASKYRHKMSFADSRRTEKNTFSLRSTKDKVESSLNFSCVSPPFSQLKSNASRVLY